jgi:hypothetical protein
MARALRLPLKTRTRAAIARSETLGPGRPMTDAIVPHHQSPNAPTFALADHVNWLPHSWGDNFVGHVAARRLHSAKHVPIHGKTRKFLQTLASSPTAAAPPRRNNRVTLRPRSQRSPFEKET